MVTGVNREDLGLAGYDQTHVDDRTMRQLAHEIAMDLDLPFYEHVGRAAERLNIPKDANQREYLEDMRALLNSHLDEIGQGTIYKIMFVSPLGFESITEHGDLKSDIKRKTKEIFHEWTHIT